MQRIYVTPESSYKITVTLFYLFIVFFIFVGLFVFVYFNLYQAIINYNVKSNWVNVPCRVISVGTKSSSSQTGNRAKTYTYCASGRYEYQYNGESYESDCLNFLSYGFGVKKLVNMQVEQYRKMDNPTCYVNPKNPNEAVLDPSLPPVALVPFGIGLFFTAMGVAMIKRYRKFKLNPEMYNKSDL